MAPRPLKRKYVQSSVMSEQRLAPGQQTKEKYAETDSRVKENRAGEQRIGSSVSRVKYYKPLSSLTATQVRDIILSSLWIESCVRVITNEVTKFDLVTNGTNPDIDAFLKYPSFKEPLMAIRKQYLGDILKYGNGARIIEYLKGKPYNLVAAPGYSLRVTENDSYKFTDITKSGETFVKDSLDETKDMELTSKEVMHFCLDKKSDETLATTALEPIYNLVTTDINVTKFLSQFSSRGMYNPFFLSGKDIKQAEMEQLLEFIEDTLDEAGRSIGINKELVLKEIPMWSMKEILQSLDRIGNMIATIYQVPPFMLNLGQAESTNAREQYARFIENVVKPIVQYESYLYTMVLAKQGFKDNDAEVSSNGLSSRMSVDIARTAKMLVESGIMSADEARRIYFGLPPAENKVAPSA